MRERYPDSPTREEIEEKSKSTEFKRRCANRDRHITWCNKLGRFCNAPYEYETCHDYTDPQKKKEQTKRLS